MVRTEQLLNSMEEEVPRMGPRQKVEEVRRSRGVIVDDYELARRLGRCTLTERVGRKRDEADHLLGVFHVDKLHIRHFSAGKTGEWRNEVWRGRQECRRGGRRPTKCGENLGAMSVEIWDIRRYSAHPKHCLVKGEVQEGRQPTVEKQFSSLLRCGQQEDGHRHCVG